MNILSLCDGMSCGQIALKELDIPIENYYACEIDKIAIKVTQDNFPDTIQLGNVMNLISSTNGNEIIANNSKLKELPKIDLVIFGSPCRSLSKATAGRKNYNNGLYGVSWLFYPCNAILQWIKKYNNPDIKFMVENVDSNSKEDLNIISQCLGVQPVLIDSGLFSAQIRLRNYWTNIEIELLPKHNDLVLKDIMDKEVPDKYFYDKEFDYHGNDKRVCATLHINGHDILKRVYNSDFINCIYSKTA